MKQNIHSLGLSTFFDLELRAKIITTGFELSINLPLTHGSGMIKGYDFRDGFSVSDTVYPLISKLRLPLLSKEMVSISPWQDVNKVIVSKILI